MRFLSRRTACMRVAAVEVPHKLSKCPIVMGGISSELPVEGLCNRLRAGVGFSLECD